MTSRANKLKVLLVNTLYAPYRFGGAERSVQQLAEALAMQGIEVAVYTLHKPGEPLGDETINGVTLFRRPLHNLYWPWQHGGRPAAWRRAAWHLVDSYNLRAKRDFADLLDRYQPDVIHCNNLAGLSVALVDEARARGKPTILTLRDYYYFHPDCRTAEPAANPAERWIQAIWRIKNRRGYRQLNALVGISDWILTRHDQQEPGRIAEQEVIYNPIEGPADGGEIDSRRARHGARPCVLGFIGRLEPAKGVAWLLDQLATYSGADGIRLLVAGEGDAVFVGQLKAKAKQLDVRFVGPMEPSEFFQQTDLSIVPSLWDEPFGRVLVEAACYGVASVVAQRGALPELVQTLGRGYIYPPDDTTAFHRALDQAIADWQTNPAPPFRLASFHPDTVAAQYRQLYRRVLANQYTEG